VGWGGVGGMLGSAQLTIMNQICERLCRPDAGSLSSRHTDITTSPAT